MAEFQERRRRIVRHTVSPDTNAEEFAQQIRLMVYKILFARKPDLPLSEG
jgi:hypothetical protein